MAEDKDQVQEPVTLKVSQMIDRIAQNQTVYFKSQQKDENDLSFGDKRSIVDKTFREKKDLFLQRYGHLLSEKELDSLAESEDDSDITVIVKSLKDSLVRNSSKSVVKNRRYQALQHLIKEGNYFSDCQMQSRNPLLFDQMVGQYMTEEEKTKLTNEKYLQNHNCFGLSSFLLEQMDNNRTDNRLETQKSAEQCEEFDTDSDEDEEYEECDEPTPKECLSEPQKLELREEFKRVMSERFLEGKDEEFYDYNQCDQNMDLDFNQINDRDIEDQYFDDDNYFI